MVYIPILMKETILNNKKFPPINENINYMNSKGEVMLTIMASLVQQDSQSLSQNV